MRFGFDDISIRKNGNESLDINEVRVHWEASDINLAAVECKGHVNLRELIPDNNTF